MAAQYAAGLVRYDVPVGDGDRISVPPLSGFVMNRVGNDYLEKLLYEVFVTNDESLTVAAHLVESAVTGRNIYHSFTPQARANYLLCLLYTSPSPRDS